MQAEKIHRKVKKLFTYETDLKLFKQMEHWTSHADEVKQGIKFKDDCDGFALTCAELCLEHYPASCVSIIYCKVPGDHLVCGIETEGTTYILDNRSNFVYPWDDRYEWLYMMKFDNLGVWLNLQK